MAFMLCVGCGLLSVAAALLAFGATGGREGRLVARLYAFVLMFRRCVARLCETRLADAVGSWKPMEQAAALVVEKSRGFDRPFTQGESVVLVLLGMCALTALATLASRSPLGGAVVLVAQLVALRLWSDARRRAQVAELAHGMPGVLRTLATALASGHTLVQAIEYVGTHERGAVAEPFARAALRLRCGTSVEAALIRLRQELDAPGVDLMVTALAISQRTGSPLRDLLQRSALLVEEREERERLLGVKTAQVRLSVRVVCCLPPLMVCVLSLVSPDFRAGLCSTPGIACLATATVMDAVALLVIRKIMEGVGE